jgi:iron complex outermembrane receptor protein
MKKPGSYSSGENYFYYKRVLLIIKLSVFMLIAGFFQLNASGTTLEKMPTAVKTDVSDKSSEKILQEKVITGIITDAATGEPLIGVTVVIDGTFQGVISDVNGKYSIQVPNNNATLTFSYVGYLSQSIPVSRGTVINIKLVVNAEILEEVVVVGYGTQNKREVSGSVSIVSEKNFNKGVSRDAVDLLQGKVAGLVITKGNGDITDNNTMRLRGTSSLTGSSEPFVVIDGVPGVSINSVSPQDIESISVLKDASAAAIYGSRSASGVIMITTKKAKSGKTSVEYDGYVAFDVVTNKPDLLTAAEWRKYCEDNLSPEAYQNLDLGAKTDWFDEIMRTGKTQNHALSLSGGTEKSNYRASFNYMDREGVVKDNDMKRFNGRLAFSQKALNDKMNLTFIANVLQSDYSPSYSRNFVLAYNMIPVDPVRNADGTWFDSQDYDHGNPVRNIELNKRLHKTTMINMNAKVDLELLKGLSAGLSLFKQREMDDYGEFNNSDTEAGRTDLGYASRSNSTRDKNLLELTLKYNLKLNNHSITLLGGYSYEDNYNQSSSAENRQFVTDIFGYNNLGAGENLKIGSVSSSASMNKLISFFGRVNYSFVDKYILTATLRRDGSSKFGDNNKWGIFPSVSLAWLISDEPFLDNFSVLGDLKLRVGYGITGNQDGLSPYKTLALYSATSTKYYDNAKYLTAYEYSQNPNPNLKWEETAMFNVGIDYDLFETRISGSIEYYNKKTNNLLYTYSVPVPPYLKDNIMANVGEMSNKGFEFIINGDVIRNRKLRWTLSLNLAHNVNEITKLSNDEFTTTSILTGSAFIRGGSNTTTHIVEEGRPVGSFYGWKCLGLDDKGKYIMQQADPDHLTNEDRTYIGCAQPKLTYGISSSLTYKNFDFSFFLRGVSGNDVLNYSRMSYASTQWLPGANVLKESLTSGLKDSPKYSSYYIEKGSFLRLDNASLGYNINTKKIPGIEKFRIYITGQNLFVITKYKGLDPEVNMNGLAPGVEGRDYYPKSRTISLGLNLTF